MRPLVSGTRRRSENSIWLVARPSAALAELGVDRAHLLHRVVGHPHRLGAPLGESGGQRVRQRPVTSEADRTVDLVQVHRVDTQTVAGGADRREQRIGHVQLPRRRHELGGQHDVVTSRKALVVPGQQPADDALALPLAVHLGRVEERGARDHAGVPRLRDGALGQCRVVAAHPPGGTVTPGPGADTERRDHHLRSCQRERGIPLGLHVRCLGHRPTVRRGGLRRCVRRASCGESTSGGRCGCRWPTSGRSRRRAGSAIPAPTSRAGTW